MTQSDNVSLEMELDWYDGRARHVDRQLFAGANPGRDILPPQMGKPFSEVMPGDAVSCRIPAGELHEPCDGSHIRRIQLTQFKRRPRKHLTVEPRRGRFYPRNFLIDVSGVDADDRRPMRILDIDEEGILIDLNPPLCGHEVTATARIREVLPAQEGRGGRGTDYIQEMIRGGVGTQAMMPDAEVDFLSGEALRRLDEADDMDFYDKARLVHHLDATCRQHLRALYQDHIEPGVKVLDLMSSWVSHFERVEGLEVTGLGLNEEELSQNPLLDRHVLQDLNSRAELPFADAEFDLVVCTASVEYLIRPLEVFAEVARCLKPGGLCIMSFSDRWFPPKAIQLWSELQPFERLGLVSAYFASDERFKDIETLSIRHYPRPEDDKYHGRQEYSDPLFAAMARRI